MFYLLIRFLFFCICSKAGNDNKEEGTPIFEISSKIEPLYSVFGNSISTFEGYIPSDYLCWFSEKQMKVEDTWWYQVGKNMSWALCNNSSWSGSRVAYDKDWEYNSYFISPYRIKNLSEKGIPDHILILGGVNDWRWNLSELGTIDDADSTSFCGAYKLMLDRLRFYYPNSTLYCISILPIAENGNTIYSENSKDWSINQANICIKDICREKGIYFIDMSLCDFCNNINNNTADGLHPNIQGMKMIADYIVQRLIEFQNKTSIRRIYNYFPIYQKNTYGINGIRTMNNEKGLKIQKKSNGNYIKILSR